MKLSKFKRGSRLFGYSLLAGAIALPQIATAELEEIVVTAERRASTVQDTAISVSAFDGDALDMRQIANTSDLQFSVPNMLFGKTNFTGSNIAIRGVGNLAVAASSDAGVGVHVNDVYMNAPRIFEAEFYDMERIEVLRGPQGTLYGRNTTGGVVNMITAKPARDFEADFAITAGDFSEQKFTGMVNVPITDNLATRIAVYSLQRDGYTDNSYTGNDIDDRDMWSARWTTSFDFSDATTATLMVSYFEEDDSRSRTSKQLCTKDPKGALGLGCFPGSKGYSFTDDQSTIGTALVDMLTAQAIMQENLYGGTSLPKYSDAVGVNSGAALTFQFAVAGILKPAFLGLGIPEEAIDAQFANYLSLGFSGDATDSFENSLNPADMREVHADFDPEYYTDETIVNFDIRHDFENYSFSSITSYHEVEYAGLTDYDWAVPSVKLNTPETYIVDGRSITTDFAQGVDRSQTETEQWSQQFNLVSDFGGAFNFTVGAYYMEFESEGHYDVYSSGLTSWANAGGLFSFANAFFGVPVPALPLAQSQYDNHSIYEVDTWALYGEGYYDLSDTTKLTVGARYSDETKNVKARIFYVDLARSVNDPFSDQENDWQEWTGKIGLDHQLDLSFTDETMIYGTLSRGYKGGGFNPPSTVEGLYPDAFEPEYINSFELGAKNRLFDNRLQANVSFFYYDFEGLQVSQIVNQTSVNENVDAEIMGLESEFMFAPNENWLFGLNVALLDAEVQDFVTVDTADPFLGGPVINVFGNLASPIGQAFVEQDLEGNKLPSSPESSVNFFVDYTHFLSNSMTLVLHADYFWQDTYYTRLFNTDADEIDSWGVSNATVTLNSADEDWFVRAWIKNIQDDDNITGHYTTDAVSGLFTNTFIMEPRTYGVTFGMSFR